MKNSKLKPEALKNKPLKHNIRFMVLLIAGCIVFLSLLISYKIWQGSYVKLPFGIEVNVPKPNTDSVFANNYTPVHDTVYIESSNREKNAEAKSEIKVVRSEPVNAMKVNAGNNNGIFAHEDIDEESRKLDVKSKKELLDSISNKLKQHHKDLSLPIQVLSVNGEEPANYAGAIMKFLKDNGYNVSPSLGRVMSSFKGMEMFYNEKPDVLNIEVGSAE